MRSGGGHHHKSFGPIKLLNDTELQTAVSQHCIILQKNQWFSILKRYQALSVPGQKTTLRRYSFG